VNHPFNRDLNIDQNNHDYHFGPNHASLSEPYFTSCEKGNNLSLVLTPSSAVITAPATAQTETSLWPGVIGNYPRHFKLL